MRENEWKMVVLDDDPTGIQTVHGCKLITDCGDEYVRQAFADSTPFFYVLTNTRAMTREQAATVTREAMEAVVRVNEEFRYKLLCVSRSDSCLRGHFPLETDTMREVLVAHGYQVMAKTPFCPALIEAGRLTIGGTHYMKDGERLIPVSETEFARDNVFAYHTSVLVDYIREKGAEPSDYEVVDAQSYAQLYDFKERLMGEVPPGVNAIVMRSSSSLPKALSGISDQPLLDRGILPPQPANTDPYPFESGFEYTPGCFIIGSHVQKTTRQLESLLREPWLLPIEVDVQRIIDDPDDLMIEIVKLLMSCHQTGDTPVVYTSRKEVRIDDADERQHFGQRVSDFLVDVVRHLPFTPNYLVGKGGITSNDILTKGLEVKVATVLGQIIPNVPCVMTKDFPYIIFPGNVGNDDSLREVYLKLGRR